jgi:predicted kinase
MSRERTLYLMCGLAFAGKTTLARALARHQKCHYLSLDEINHERGFPHGGTGLPLEVWAETHQIALARLEQLTGAGRDVVIDDTSCLRMLRDNYREIAERSGYRTVLVFLDIPLDEIQRRRKQNDESGDRNPLKETVFDDLLESFEYPEPDEEVLRFKHGDSLPGWLYEHFPVTA